MCSAGRCNYPRLSRCCTKLLCKLLDILNGRLNARPDESFGTKQLHKGEDSFHQPRQISAQRWQSEPLSCMQSYSSSLPINLATPYRWFLSLLPQHLRASRLALLSTREEKHQPKIGRGITLESSSAKISNRRSFCASVGLYLQLVLRPSLSLRQLQ